MARLVYRGGSLTADNFTPRTGKDTEPRPGVSPGLSVFTTLEQAVDPGGKAQRIDLDRLSPPLQGFPDDATLEYGSEGHLSIAPTRDDGTIDSGLLEEWAATRGTDQTHDLTRNLLDAVESENVRRPK